MNQKLLLFFAVLFVGIASAQTFSVGGVNYSVISTTNSTVGVVASASYVGALVVPSTVVNASVTYSVVSISDSAFQGSTTLTSITIPNTVTEIRNGAFRFCTNLSSVDLGTSVTSIGQLSFASCSSLTSIVIPGSVASIGIEAFSFCTSLTSVTVNWPTPISVNTTAFVGVNVGSATLNVPLGTVGLYEAAPVWQDFGTIMQPQSGSHLNFDGVNDYVTVNVGAANLQVNNYTHELWFRTTSPTGTLFNNAGTGAPNAGQHNKVLSLVGGKLRSYVYNGVGSFIESTTNFNDGNWHHVAEIVSTTERRLYVDGILVGTSNALPTQNLDYITLGNSNYTPLNYYNGDIDEVRIWNVARTLDQIYASKNCELQGTETGLVAYYKFNQGISQGNNTGETTLINSVATGANGTLTNFTLTGTTSNFLAGSPVTTGSIVPSNATVTTPVVYNQGATATALTATPGTNGTGLVWYTTATGGIGTTAPTPSTATAGNTSYWVASTNANGCESVRTEIVVTINSSAVVSCFVTIQTGDSHSLAIANNGTLWSWGLNSSGQLGLGDTTTRTSPVQVGTETNWVSISSEGSHALAIKSNGTLWSWGLNSSGQLGLGDTTNRTSPTQVGTDTDWVFLSADYEHSLAIKSNGTLWSWGKNNGGQLGLNDLTNRNLPTQVGSANNWTKVNAGGGHSIGIKSNGTLWTWGNNSNGQLGMGNTTSLFIPTQVGSGSNWTSVNAGGGDTLAVKSDGTLWGCGYNAFGQLGFGTNTVYELSFSQSGTSTDWKYVTTSGRSSIAAKNDDTIWSFGYGANYQLGLGMNSDVNVPTQIGSDTWQSISLSDTFGIGIKFDGTIWVWGLNGSGQLGLGTTTNQTTPLQFSCPAVLSSSSFDIASNINVYPNPTNGNVNVETNNLTNVSVSVYDLNGRQILNKELAANENAVDISNFQSGLYLFRIKSTEGETVKKVIKN